MTKEQLQIVIQIVEETIERIEKDYGSTFLIGMYEDLRCLKIALKEIDTK